MLFNSLEFILFLPTVFIFYWFVFNKDLNKQNSLILISSYTFYGWWDIRFLFLIILSTIVDYFVGLGIYNNQNIKVRKFYLCLSIFINLGVLFFFKYFNFFIDSWVELLNSFGYQQNNVWSLNLILPVGISFYTFQTMSYSLDIYFKKISPTKDFISFATFVSFFPQLVAGPIERASSLLPQIISRRKFDLNKSTHGLRLILWGMFKKVVIADSLGILVNKIFLNYSTLDGGVLALGLVYFSFQIYCDFSGYSDIAIGTAKLFGFDLMSNFKLPYFSRDISEFWRKWHISLSTWFRDYLFIPLGGSKKGTWISIRNVFCIFLISGFWHGANWTFIFWGLIHSLFFMPFIIKKTDKTNQSKVISENTFFPSFQELTKVLFTYSLTTFAWVFFRSESISDSFSYIYLMFTKFSFPNNDKYGFVFILLLLAYEWSRRKDVEDIINFKNMYLRYFNYLFISYCIFAHFQLVDLSQFIYFQF